MSPAPRLVAHMNLAPLAGVLLAVFVGLLGALPSTSPAIALDLPPAAPPPCACGGHEPSVVVMVEPNGAISVNGRSADLASLPQIARRELQATGRDSIQLRAHRQTRYGEFAAAADALQAARVGRLVLINETF